MFSRSKNINKKRRKNMTKLFKKFFIATLSFVMMIACAFTFTTYKASASTNDDVVLSNEEVSAFVAEALEELSLSEDGDHICFIVDGRFFTNTLISYSLNSTTTLSDLNNSAFIQQMAKTLAAKIQMDIEDETNVNNMVDASAVFAEINMDILIHISGTSYVNIITQGSHSLSSGSALARKSFMTPDSCIYGMIIFEPITAFYNFLVSTQSAFSDTEYYAKVVTSNQNPGSLNVSMI